jgi:hypothetical protein
MGWPYVVQMNAMVWVVVWKHGWWGYHGSGRCCYRWSRWVCCGRGWGLLDQVEQVGGQEMGRVVST